MTLREQYETLLRRGMPAHPRLKWNEEKEAFYFDGRGDGLGILIVDTWARDLITMHALRWVNGLHNVHWRNGLHYSTGDGNKTLTDILAATAHLEPK